jgi:hypothetical protein
MINLTIGFALGFAAALYPPARTVVMNGVRKVIAYFRTSNSEQ